MANNITEKKPPVKQTVGAMYICFALQIYRADNITKENELISLYNGEYDGKVSKLKTVKSVTVTENSDSNDVYASGDIYDSNDEVKTEDIQVETIAFPDEILAMMKGETITESKLVYSGGNGIKPYFAFGKVVKYKGDKYRYEWYPKCRLTENTNQANTKEEKYSEQTDTINIKAYPFDDNGNIVTRISSEIGMPEGLTEDRYFSKVILTEADLISVIQEEQE